VFKRALFIVLIGLLLSCENTDKLLQNINKREQNPIGVAYNIKIVYTDSAKVKAILTAPEHKDFTNLSFEYSEFTKGVKIVFFDNKKDSTEVVADYGILYNQTKIVDLRENVKIKMQDGGLLETNQLYWDFENEWIFTEAPFRFKDSSYDINAIRLDANKEFTIFQTGKVKGTIKSTDIE